MIYIDNHATTQLDGKVLEAMMPYLTEEYGNASSNHRHGLAAAAALDESRQHVSTILSCHKENIYFTGGATESNNTIIKGMFFNALRRGIKNPHFISTEIEHKCILESLKYIMKFGADVTFLKVDSNGEINLRELEESIKPSTLLISVMMANNEIGVVNPIKDIVDIAHRHDVPVHTDAAQAIGKMRVNVTELGIDAMSSSAHKHYGPKGIGTLYIANTIKDRVDPLLHGGGQEDGMRSGTSNTPGIVGLGESMRLFCDDQYIAKEMGRQDKLIAQLYQGLREIVPNVQLNGPELHSPSRLPNNLNVSFPTINEKIFNKKIKGLMISSGSACSSADLKPSYVLSAIGVADETALKSYRFGVGKNTTTNDIEKTLEIIKTAYDFAKIS